MQVVERPFMAPSICMVCERKQPKDRFVDTRISFNPAARTHLNGRKYICETCARTFAEELGITAEARAEAEAELAAAMEELEAAREAADVIDAVRELSEQLKPFAPKPKRKTKKS